MRSDPFHVALIVPASNTVMEPDFHRHAGSAWTTSTWRIHLDNITREAETRMLRDELPPTLARIASTDPALAVFGCTSAGSLDGLDHDRGVADQIEEVTGAPAITVVGSLTDQLRSLDATRVAVFTPYATELTDSVAGCVSEAGFEVVLAQGMGFLDNGAVGRVTPEEIEEFALAGLSSVSFDCVFLSCTNWQAIGAITPLREALDVPVISSNQVTIDNVRNRAARSME